MTTKTIITPNGTEEVELTSTELEQQKLDIAADVEEQKNDWIRNRQADYPDMGSQLNKIYDDGVTKWKSEMVDPVKAKWPKDNSGPV